MSKKITAPRAILLGYIIIILIGTLLLSLPAASTHGRCSLVDSAFTATSGICVTGLIVKDTGQDFTRFGKIVILVLIQLGGLGYMTIASLLFLAIGGRLSIRQAAVTEEAMAYPYGGVGHFVLQVVKVALGLELLGTIILGFHFLKLGFPLPSALFKGLFHAVSAFCNAGFSVFSDNLLGFARDPLVTFTVSGLFIVGGIGFIVIQNIYRRIKRETTTFSLHTKLVFWATLILLAIGIFSILSIEWNGVLKHLSLGHKFSAAFFQAATPRTAGFSVVPVGEYKLGTKFINLILMFIGASPGGTGGGIKTTTFALILMSMMAYFYGRRSATGFGRRIEKPIIERAVIVALVSTGIVIISLLVIALSQRGKDFMGLVFEVFSAFGTVGLSAGSKINPACSLAYDFTTLGKFMIILTMLAGRVGSLTIGTAIITRTGPETFQLPKEAVLTG